MQNDLGRRSTTPKAAAPAPQMQMQPMQMPQMPMPQMVPMAPMPQMGMTLGFWGILAGWAPCWAFPKVMGIWTKAWKQKIYWVCLKIGYIPNEIAI